MEKLGIQLIILVLCTGASFPNYIIDDKRSHSDSSGYQLVKKSKGIELYEKWYEISSSLLAREVRVIYQINASLESTASMIENGEKATLWNKGSNQYRIVPVDENSWVSYIQYDLPWPLDNQDCVLHYTVSTSTTNQISIDFKSVEFDMFPPLNNVSRITDIKGKWILKTTPEGTLVDYAITTMPSSTLPRWVTDPIVRTNLIDSMDEFRNLLESSKN